MATTAADRQLAAPAAEAGERAELRIAWLPILAAAATVVTIMLTRGRNASVLLYGFGALAVALGLSRPAIGLTTLIVVSSIDGISKGVLPGWFTLLFKDVVLWACLARWLAMRKYTAAGDVAKLRTTFVVVLFMLWVFAEGANVFASSLLVTLAGIRSWIGWIPVFFIAYEGFQRRSDILSLAYSMVIVAAAVGTYGVVQSRIGLDHLMRISPNFDYVEAFRIGETAWRVISTMPHPGMFGHYMATVLPIAIGLTLTPTIPTRQRLVAALCTVAIAGGAISSGARLAFASLLTSGVLILLLARRAKAILIGGLLAAVITVAVVRLAAPEAITRVAGLFDWEETIYRVTFPLKKALRYVNKAPLGTGVASGVGLGRALQLLGGKESVEIARPARGMIEGDFGRALRELGIPGGILFVWLIAHVLFSALGAHRAMGPRPWRYITAAYVASIISVVLGLLVGPALYLMPMAAVFWIDHASVLRLREIDEANQRQREADEAAEPVRPR